MKLRTSAVLDILACLHAWILFAGLYPFFASLFSFHGADFRRMTLCSLLVLLPVILGFLLLQYLHNMFLYIFSGLLITAAGVVFSYLLGGVGLPAGNMAAILYGVISLTVFAIHLHTKVMYGKEKREFMEAPVQRGEFTLQIRDMPGILLLPQPYHWAWLTILYVFGMLLHFTACLYCLFGLALADVFICLLHRYIRALETYARQNRTVANFPVRNMQRIHRLTGIAGFVMLAFFLLPAVLFGREFQINLTTDAPLVSLEAPTEEAFQPAGGGQVVDTELMEAMLDSGHDAPEWLLALFEFIGYLILAFCVIAAVIALVRKLRSMGLDFSTENADEIISLDTADPDEAKAIDAPPKERALSINQRIRRRYRKTIRKATKGRPSRCATPAELEQNAAVHNDALHTVYEKARYSKDGCSREDLSQL
ncbi:MAG: hypothetical protein NC180_07415 [Muribaculaceae bacterium]|nr:hypothetical protein [Roseburia sp.]MCM1429940.1 hypothetical protein [Muribaculaceae bacterium]MCM1493033.1 hypothetical protein [Muribaculaceae bacterium]